MLRLALLALVMHLLLPVVHAAQMLDAQRAGITGDLCSVAHHTAAGTQGHPDAAPDMSACPLCAAMAGQQLLLAFAPSASLTLPIQVGPPPHPASTGAPVATPVFARPPSHAPPLRIA